MLNRKWAVLAFVTVSLVSTGAWAQDDRFYVEAEGEIDGKPVSVKCERQGMKAVREFGDNFFPSPGNKFRSYQVACSKGGKFAGASFKFRSDSDPSSSPIPPFNGTGPDHTWENKDAAFTVRFADGASQVQIHSFMNSEERKIRQHFVGAPALKITEFKREVETAGKKTKAYHVIAGELNSEFEDKIIKGKEKGSKGKVRLRFRTRVKEVLDPGAKLPAWPPAS